MLYTILNNPYSILGKLQYNELTSGKKAAANQIDASSGATTIVDKNAVVTGAVFTCFTLWHLVQDTAVMNGILENSKKYLYKAYQNEPFSFKNINVLNTHPGMLAFLLKKLNDDKKLRKYKYQNILTENIDSLSPISALTINNIINRQPFVFPGIASRLANCKLNEVSFSKMILLNPYISQNDLDFFYNYFF